MKSWPSLAPFGRILPMPGAVKGGGLFYYDSAGSDDSAGSANSEGNDDSGKTKPAVILIHGLGDEADTWRHIFPLLVNAGYRVIAPDLPGFGRSQWKGRISLRSQCGALIRLMSAAGAATADHPAVLAGNSLGTGIAELVAVKRPELVKGLILLDGCFPFEGGSGKAAFMLTLPFIGSRWYRSFRLNHDAAWKSLYPYYSDLDAMDDADRAFLGERVIARVESPNQERGYLATLRSMNIFFLIGKKNLARRIKNFRGKIILLWGEQDMIFRAEKNAVFRRLRPDADFALIAGAGHLPHQEKPAATAAEILRFLREEEDT